MTPASNTGAGLLGLEGVSRIIYDMTWVGLRAPDDPLVVGDHPVVIHDPAAGPEQPAAWLSGGEVVVTFPLAPNFCLMLHHQGKPRSYCERSLHRSEAEEINLRSIAHAWRHYYGPTQHCVQNARRLAKEQAERVAALKPVPGGLIVSHRMEGATKPLRVDVHEAPEEIRVSRPRKR